VSDYFAASHRDELLGENRQLKERIKRLEEALDKTTKIASKHIKRLEEAGDVMVNEGWNEPHLAEAWRKAKEAKL